VGHGETIEQLKKGAGVAQEVDPPHEYPSEQRRISDEFVAKFAEFPFHAIG
jgi:hypothetical protein